MYAEYNTFIEYMQSKMKMDERSNITLESETLNKESSLAMVFIYVIYVARIHIYNISCDPL